MGTSDSLLHQIQEKIKWADTMSEVNKKHQKEFEDRVEEAKKSIKVSLIKLKFLVFTFSRGYRFASYDDVMLYYPHFPTYFHLTAICLDYYYYYCYYL